MNGNKLTKKRSFDHNVHSPAKNWKKSAENKDYHDNASKLPIFKHREEIVTSLRNHATTIIIGETGSGKSTQIPQYLVNANRNLRIVCTQPRRVAAVTVAERVAQERNCEIGQEVGYCIRFDDRSSHRTKIKYVTDGVLLRETMLKPELDDYDVIILDEAHERSLQTDILMGLLRLLQEKRTDLKVIVMSATLQVELFSSFFKDVNTISVPGRQFPVDVYYLHEPEEDYVDAAMLTCLQIHEHEEAGDVLVFLPGQDEIESLHVLLEQNLPSIIMSNAINDHSNSTPPATPLGIGDDFLVRPLYASLPTEEQMLAFKRAPANVRKFILATNIAETSVTISGIKYVIDAGYVKTKLLQPTTGVEMLKIAVISQSQANQRAGRAGRECAGRCYRLYTESAYEQLAVTSIPEIQRVNIAQVILQLKVLGIKDLSSFPFVSPPSDSSLRNALKDLYLLQALDKNQELTTFGRSMSRLPLDPTYATLLLKSREYGCVAEILTAVSMLSSDNIYLHPHREADKQRAYQAHKQFASPDGDLLNLVTIYNHWIKVNQDVHWSNRNFFSQRSLLHAHNIRNQLISISSDHHNKDISSTIGLELDPKITCLPNKEPFLRCLAAGLCLQIAKRSSSMISTSSAHLKHKHQQKISSKDEEGRAPYRTLRGGLAVYVHPSSSLFNTKNLPEYVTYAEMLTTSKQFMRNVTAVDKTWLSAAAPHVIKDMEYANI